MGVPPLCGVISEVKCQQALVVMARQYQKERRAEEQATPRQALRIAARLLRRFGQAFETLWASADQVNF